MTKLNKLKNAKTLSELADLLGYKPKGLSYILYKMANNKKYRTFTIPKKYGGLRTIQAPDSHLSVIQTRLAQMLYECVEEYKQNNSLFWSASHGFQKKRTIVSNAEVHKRKRFVFNLDLEDFFGTINFGRVRGFFINDRMFKLDPAVATVIAQIACYQNKLPQGSPCSPIISNLIGNILDSRLLALARDTQCTYTRYADDLTFSKNKGEFPPEIAIEMGGGKWVVGKKLENAIKSTGFTINSSKTRMSLKQSRQTVTGLVVNKKVNIKKEYYLNARAMCHTLFKDGEYYIPHDKNKIKISNLNHLEGTLSHIYFVKGRRDRSYKINKFFTEKSPTEFIPPKIFKKLYKSFLFYKHFVIHNAPLIITEGSSDIVYLKCAIRLFAGQFTSLVTIQGAELKREAKFLRSSKTIHDVLNLVNGADGQKALVNSYEDDLARYKHNPPIKPPIIILCDNDKGVEKLLEVASKVASKTASDAAGKKVKVTINIGSTEDFYKLFENLYLVKVPENKNRGEKKSNQEKVIEELFSEKLLNTKLKTKSFNYKNKINENTEYGKDAFAQKVVLKAKDPDDFADFIPLLKRIQGAIEHHKNNP